MKQSFIKRKKNNRDSAVSEVIGTVLLLGISVTLFSIVYVSILSTPNSPPTPDSNIAYSFNNNNLTLTHVGGKPLDENTEVKILINNELVNSSKVKDKWEMGEQLIYDLSDYISETDYSIEVQVIDVNSNSIVMIGKTSIKNRPPSISSPDPYNNETNVSRTIEWLNIIISEPDNDAFSWTIETTPDIGHKSGDNTEKNFNCFISELEEDTDYTWYVNATDINGKSTEKTYTFTTRKAKPIVEHKDSIDINSSNVDDSEDIGTETDFTNCKANTTDNNVMIIKEYKPLAYHTNDTVNDNTANKDESADIGTETNFVNCKDIIPDTDAMTLQEANKGWIAGSENLNVNNFDSTTTGWSTTGTTPYLGADDTANVYTSNNGAGEAWFNFADTTGPTGAPYTVVLYVKGWGDGNDWANPLMDWTGDTGVDKGDFCKYASESSYNSVNLGTTFTQAQVNAMRLKLTYTKSSQANNLYVDHAYLAVSWTSITDYELDMEYQFNNTKYNSDNKQLCFYLTTPPTETLNVTYWSGSWIGLGNITHSGWTNFTAKELTSSTYNIRIRDQNQTNEPTQHSWTIDSMFLHTWNNSDYKINFEYQFTGANYSDMYETLCIYVTSPDTEPLKINYWDGDSWEPLGIITMTGWKNVTAIGLTNSIYTIQLIGSTEINDNQQGDWSIDCIYLHTWND